MNIYKKRDMIGFIIYIFSFFIIKEKSGGLSY